MNSDLTKYSVSIFNLGRFILDILRFSQIKTPVLIEFMCQCEAVDNKYVNNIIIFTNIRYKILWTIVVNNLFKLDRMFPLYDFFDKNKLC